MTITRFLLVGLSLWMMGMGSGGVRGETAMDRWFEKEVKAIEGGLEREVKTKEDWLAKKGEYRRQLAEMLGLDPMPERTDLKATKTGEFEHEGIVVEKLHYQSMPGLYVTANLYRPKVVNERLPTVLYLSGHADKQKDGVSFGNKSGYSHHGVWYAKHGFVCLIIDTVQLGEIRGHHHGTHRLGRFWWMSRGYTPAGVEAWAGIRGLDYLETRSEVDKTRFGVAGRSGGGAYSWWVAALDERVKVAVPTAGITTLKNHVVDGKVSGHCDCMFMVNSYQWDFDKVAALVAPRPLLIANTDKDPIFPLDGVVKVYEGARRIYGLLGAEKNIGLHIAEGGHANVQPLNVGEFHWMTRFLQGAEAMSTFDGAAVPSGVAMEKLRVFEGELPKDEINTTVDEVFVKGAVVSEVPGNEKAWEKMRDGWRKDLETKTSFRNARIGDQSGKSVSEDQAEGDGLVMKRHRLFIDDEVSLELFLVHSAKVKPEELDLVVLNVLDDEGWGTFANTYGAAFGELLPKGTKAEVDEEAFEAERKMFGNFKWGMAYVAPRGEGPTAFVGTEKERTQWLRKFYLLGTTLETEQVLDVRCAIRGLRAVEGLKETKLWLQASRGQAVNAVYASLFEEGITRLDLHEMPGSHREVNAPNCLNVLKFLDVPQAVAMAAERTRVIIYGGEDEAWELPMGVAEKLEWGGEKGRGVQLRKEGH
ncbi:hypothetical protein FEM03_19060 [Phragmitibacter flavus]|uniref:Acetyl xylan esterase domain-containing protein n=1 Tax=Phragmitibacter flavus TaxID=2576071 RepID=A0A5R8KA76_9BACT|nr:acetylxylan esterase [Phragmitibacter flavus]TLD69201.1 hypothetical protein FEM03_19060 [Phragmitibacter flavus]